MAKRTREIRPIRSKIEPIPDYMRNPDPKDERFVRSVGGVTIFLAEGIFTTIDRSGGEYVRTASYAYSDRISKIFGYGKLKRAQEDAIEAVGNNDTAAYYEVMLQRVYEDPTRALKHIIANINNDSGRAYHIYGTVSGHTTEK